MSAKFLLVCYTLVMPYNFTEISDNDLKLFFAVINDLQHKAVLAGSDSKLTYKNTPKGVTRDEQMAILHRLDDDHYISFSMNKQLIYLNEKMYKDRSFTDLFKSVHGEYHKRFKETEKAKNEQPHYDEANGMLHIQDHKIKVIKHDEDTKQNQFLKYIFITNAKNLNREFDFTEFPFEDVGDKKKFKEICRTACTAINGKIARETKNEIVELLQFNSRTYGWVKINPKYLPT